jgi:hypothetical protein
MFEPKNLFPLIALVFAIAAMARLLRAGGKVELAARTWLPMAVIFGSYRYCCVIFSELGTDESPCQRCARHTLPGRRCTEHICGQRYRVCSG